MINPNFLPKHKLHAVSYFKTAVDDAGTFYKSDGFIGFEAK